ncbi:MAG: SUMF1/EgtB/PvdO family nonheme iron enzyme [Lentisphaeria bacterium]|nr:SUMF1/EgtB/PvdO family nonheme iron enzyme [Lentisphaeria bacterium]
MSKFFKAGAGFRGRVLLIAAGLAAVVLAVAGSILLRVHWKNARIREWRRQIRGFDRLNGERRDLLGLQLREYLPDGLDEYERLSADLHSAEDAGNWTMCVKVAKKLQEYLGGSAEKLMPEIPADTADFPTGFAVAGAVHGYLSSPLAVYLDPARRADFDARFTAFEKLLYGNWHGLRCGENLTLPQTEAELVFVPPGVARLTVNGNPARVRIPYPFWIGRNEVTHEQMAQVLNIVLPKTARPDTPADRLAWNDVLFYCAVLTRRMQEAQILPPGYIIRPPNEEEWQLAADNAWLGADRTPLSERAWFKDNSGQHTRPSGGRKPNKLGLNDIYGNIAEMTLPYSRPDGQEDRIAAMGGSFASPEKLCYLRHSIMPGQSIPAGVGFRIAAAPGTPDYFDRHFQLGCARQVRTGGKVFELIGGSFNAFDRNQADSLCRLLGGRLAEVTGQKQLNVLRAALPLFNSGSTLLGARAAGGRWIWAGSGKPVRTSLWRIPKPKRPTDSLVIVGGRTWKPVSDKARVPFFLCEWDEADYARRNGHLQTADTLPLVRRKFTVGDRTFLLIESGMTWNAACRFCELLGGRLACPDTPELADRVRKELKPFAKRRILLGGYARRDEWLWLSGKKIGSVPEPDGKSPLTSRNRNFIVLKWNRFWNGQSSQMFLCELPQEAISSR